MKKTVFIITLIILACFGGYILNDFIKRPDSNTGTGINNINDEDIYTPSAAAKTSVTDTLINGIGKENKLITTEVNLNCEILIDDTYFDWSIFKKQETINFYGTALFTTDLNNLNREDIFCSETDGQVILHIEIPQLLCVNLDNNKTVINKTETGLFRFGNIKLSSLNFKTLQSQAVNKMTEQLNNDEIKTLTESNAKTSIKDLFQKILASTNFSEYDIIIEFK